MRFFKRNLWILLMLVLTNAVAQPSSYVRFAFHLYDLKGKIISPDNWHGFYRNSRAKNFDGETILRPFDKYAEPDASAADARWCRYGFTGVSEDLEVSIVCNKETMTINLVGSGEGGCFEIDSLLFTPGKFALITKLPCLKLWKIDFKKARVDYYNSLLDDYKKYRYSASGRDILMELNELKKSYQIKYSDTSHKTIDDFKLPGPPS